MLFNFPSVCMIYVLLYSGRAASLMLVRSTCSFVWSAARQEDDLTLCTFMKETHHTDFNFCQYYSQRQTSSVSSRVRKLLPLLLSLNFLSNCSLLNPKKKRLPHCVVENTPNMIPTRSHSRYVTQFDTCLIP